ncbi:MAG: MDR family MFS transporter [Rhodococcus sp. (in: high G+C Gram-positive bacteria)]|uniref:MDR family MFS transporter n=1 Tax=Rhodococcus sp. TaxID=1831 RepID=UPI003BB64134
MTTDRTPARATSHGLVFLFAGLMLTMLLASLNQTALNPALPTIVGELHGADLMLWVITAYILTSTITMPAYGKLGDLFGRKPLLLSAIGIFLVGSIVSGTAGDITWLIIGRAIQGAGGGLMILSQAAIADVVPARERGRYLGVMSGVFALSSVAGPLLGGWFTEGPGWRWVFWITVPLSVLAATAAIVFLRLPARAGPRSSIDVAGMTVLSVATTGIVLVGTWGGTTYAWTSPMILCLIAGTAVATILFGYVEYRAAEPVLPLHLFRDRNFDLITLAGLLVSVALFGVAGYMPTYLQMATGVDATVAGLLMLPMMGSLFLTSTLAGRVVTKTGRYKAIPIIGSALIAIGLVLLSQLTVTTPTWVLGCFIAVIGVGLGLTGQLMMLVVQNSFPIEEVGTATAAGNYFRQIGATLGAAVVGSVFAGRAATLIAERAPATVVAESLTPEAVRNLPDAARLPVVEAYNDALTPIFLWISPLALVAMMLLCFVVEKPLATTIERRKELPVGATTISTRPVAALPRSTATYPAATAATE